MNGKDDITVIFSDKFSSISSESFNEWGIHLLCLRGKGEFDYNSGHFQIFENDAIVISHPTLIRNISFSPDLEVIFVAAPFKFLYSLLPANHYGISGCISLFDDPVIPLSDDDALKFQQDLLNIRERIGDTAHLFYPEMIGSLLLTMMYDLFDFHAKIHTHSASTDRTSDLLHRFMTLLEGGRSKHHRGVAYYADILNVTPKYLSDTVKRATGRSVMYLIDRHTVPLIVEYLENSKFSLTQISEEFRFSSLAYFSRYVRKHLGVSPKEFRSSLSPR